MDLGLEMGILLNKVTVWVERSRRTERATLRRGGAASPRAEWVGVGGWPVIVPAAVVSQGSSAWRDSMASVRVGQPARRRWAPSTCGAQSGPVVFAPEANRR